MMDPRVMAHVGGVMTEAAANELFEAHVGAAERPRLYAAWAVEDPADGAYVGSGSLLRNDEEEALEVGYLLLPAHWGKGYATAVARALLDHAHGDLDRSRVVATVDTDHPASIRVLDKVGMRFARRGQDEEGDFLVYESTR